MKIIPLHGRGAGGVQGWVVANRKNPTPKADAFCPSQEGILEIHSDSLSIAVSFQGLQKGIGNAG